MGPGNPMKAPFYKNRLFWIIPEIFLILTVVSVYATDGGVMDRIKKAVVPVKTREIDDLVTYLPEDAILADEEYQGGQFWTESRKDKINRFKCSSCHNDEKITVRNAAEMAHGDISLAHGAADKPLNCYTCHNKMYMDFLKSEKNSKIDMDRSYKLCGQCHFRQKKDWIGGAHGKRIGCWAGERVIMNCTSCHDPHSPRFKERWPETYSSPDAK
jgi:formate-dependent nitrite reductase cytochrome c552 subunit